MDLPWAEQCWHALGTARQRDVGVAHDVIEGAPGDCTVVLALLADTALLWLTQTLHVQLAAVWPDQATELRLPHKDGKTA